MEPERRCRSRFDVDGRCALLFECAPISLVRNNLGRLEVRQVQGDLRRTGVRKRAAEAPAIRILADVIDARAAGTFSLENASTSC